MRAGPSFTGNRLFEGIGFTVAVTHAGRRRHTKVWKLGALVDGTVQVSSVPLPSPCWGQAPALHLSFDPWL